MAHDDEKAFELRRVALAVCGIFASAPSRIEPATGGVSTTVYRIWYGRETFYLRLLPDVRDSFASEVAVHARLLQLGVQVPTVVHYEHHHPGARGSRRAFARAEETRVA